MTQLRLMQVKKSYGRHPVLDIPDLSLQAGRSYVLMGSNGCGKSTLLRMLAGLEGDCGGELEFRGQSFSLARYPAWARREIVYVHQHPYLFSGTVAANVAYGLKARGVPRARREGLVREAIAWAGMEHLAERSAQKLSGGEKQRVALARARVLSPQVYLFDEPTANLDAWARQRVIELIGDLCGSNHCVVVACHDHEILRLPGMERLLLAGGRLARDGQTRTEREEAVPGYAGLACCPG